MKTSRLVSIVALAIFVSGCSGSSDVATTPVEQIEASAPNEMTKEAACDVLVSSVEGHTNILDQWGMELQLDANGMIVPPSAKIQMLFDDLINSLTTLSQDAGNEEVKILADHFVSGLTAWRGNTSAGEAVSDTFFNLPKTVEEIFAFCS